MLRDGTEQRVPVAELAAGERFVVRPGEKIAADGVVVEGRSAVDASLVTGESMPAEVGPGDEVIGSCVSMSGRLVVRATRVGADTLLAQITRLVSQAQMSKAAAQRLADRIAAVFVPSVISVAAATLGFWLGAGLPGAAAWSAAIAVLVVACPCALGLATPTALLAGVGRGAELGILVKSVHALESARRVRTVVLDKTGTLTRGTMTSRTSSRHRIGPAPGADETDVLLLAGAVEDASEHPDRAGHRPRSRGPARRPAPGHRFHQPARGRGARDRSRPRVTVGSPAFLAEQGLAIGAGLQAAIAAAEGAGRTAVLAGWDGRARACWSSPTRSSRAHRPRWPACGGWACGRSCSPGTTSERPRRPRPSWASRGQRDRGSPPGREGRGVSRLQEAGGRVAMVGDGVNDAAALAQADLGMAVGTGTDAAIGAADLTLVSGDLATIADAILLARATLRVIRANLVWAFGYNVVAIPLAALGYLNPLFAGVAMSASSLIVVPTACGCAGSGPGTQPCRNRNRTAWPPSRCPRHDSHSTRSGASRGTGQGPRAPGRGDPGRGRTADLRCPDHRAAGRLGGQRAGPDRSPGSVSRSGWPRSRCGLSLPSKASTIHQAPTYLTIRNLSGQPDELLSVRTPVARRVILTGPPGPRGTRPTVPGLANPATAASR